MSKTQCIRNAAFCQARAASARAAVARQVYLQAAARWIALAERRPDDAGVSA
jgi:hypothetical protein